MRCDNRQTESFETAQNEGIAERSGIRREDPVTAGRGNSPVEIAASLAGEIRDGAGFQGRCRPANSTGDRQMKCD